MFRSSIVRRGIPIAAMAVAAFSAGAPGTGTVVAAAQAAAAYVYGFGPQGLGYYLVPGAAQVQPQAAAPQLAVPPRAPSSTPSAGRSVGPGVRNWATGNRVPSHRPWLRSRS